jgi:photosystem II stability/assembly factor-like uncharacterized protein
MYLKPFFISFLIVLLLHSCKKKDNQIERTFTPGPADTLNGWSRIATGTIIWDVVFESASKGFAVAQSGIYKSVDSGKTWQKIPDTTNFQYFNIMQVSPTTLFANNQLNIIYSFDGGNTWSRNGVSNTTKAKDLFFVSNSTGYITSRNALYKTTDTGKTWQTVINGDANGFWFFNSMRAVSIVNKRAYRTGWTSGYEFLESFTAGDNIYHMMDFVDNLNGWFANENTLYKTVDGGVTWSLVHRSDKIKDIDFVSPSTGFYCTATEIYKTTDSGSTWTRICKIRSGDFTEIFFLDENTGWANGTGGYLRWRQ